MKNIVSTIIVFSSIFIIIVAGAFVFDRFNGFGLIDNVDSSLNNGIKKVLESENDNITENHTTDVKDNISNDKLMDNDSNNIETNIFDNTSNKDNHSDYIDDTIDNESIINNSVDNNTPSDNSSDGVYI